MKNQELNIVWLFINSLLNRLYQLIKAVKSSVLPNNITYFFIRANIAVTIIERSFYIKGCKKIPDLNGFRKINGTILKVFNIFCEVSITAHDLIAVKKECGGYEEKNERWAYSSSDSSVSVEFNTPTVGPKLS